MAEQAITKHSESDNRNRWYSSNVVDIEPALPPRTVRALHNEHIYISNLLSSLEELVEQINAGKEADFQFLLDIVDYMKNFPDRFHHPKEDLIYQRMALRDEGSVHNVQILLEEHRYLEKLINRLGDSVDDYHLLPTVLKRKRVAEICREYVDRMREHINMEEGVMLPRSVEVLREEDWFLIEQQSTPIQEIPIDHMLADNYTAVRRYMHGNTEKLVNSVVLAEFLVNHSVFELMGGLGVGISYGRRSCRRGAKGGWHAYVSACKSWFPLLIDQPAGDTKYRNPVREGWTQFTRGLNEERAPRDIELLRPFTRAMQLYSALMGGRVKSISDNT